MEQPMDGMGKRRMNTKSSVKPFTPWPSFEEDEIAAADAVLRSGKVNYWTGEEGREFEKEFADFVGVRHAIALANGTVALEAALVGLGIGPGDDVVVTCRTFVASASCVVMRGARPVMADVSPVSQNITADTIRRALTPATRAIIVVHLAGWPCDMDSILELARERGIFVVEDCAQAVGARYKGRPVGCLGHAAAFSFCQDKIMTTGGEGGMLTTNDREVWGKAWAFKDHGKNHETVYCREHPPGFRWLVESFGTNWRMTEMQAAIGRVQLRKVPRWVEIRRRHAAFLNERFREVPGLRITVPGEDIFHAYYKYYCFVDPAALKEGWSRDRIVAAVDARGVPCMSGSCGEIYLEKAFECDGLRPAERFEAARQLAETSLMFKVHSTLDEQHMEGTCQAVEEVLRSAVR
ncbi:DegT/DnrJ/EryC1/StrS aminotransferase [Syntrophobacter fumaroxidans MPOB]|uniref:DegT/DnrJ/EryC1/StrS aminotransferase n=2 Tax=Syntrophobacter TaxID=29526 RepID=A0LGE0_SYNFM|nr:DegT/DnrJ/EryC1/StrS aminotransferase [Syntrophobacter fumaroxidans MPOB]